MRAWARTTSERLLPSKPQSCMNAVPKWRTLPAKPRSGGPVRIDLAF